MAIEERSAGVVVFRQRAGSPQEFLLLDYGKYWDYAKGHVEPGEDDLTAAQRELHEETGIDEVELIDGFRHEIVYYFRSKRGLIRKTVIFFLGRAHAGANVAISREHTDYAWLPFPEALERLTYTSAKEVLRAAQQSVQERARRRGTTDERR